MKKYKKVDFWVGKDQTGSWSRARSRPSGRRTLQPCRTAVEFIPIDETVRIGNSSDAKIDKLERFKLTSHPATMVKAPLVGEYYADFERKLVDARLVQKYNFLIFEVVKARAARGAVYPRTAHCRGDGVFMISGGLAQQAAKAQARAYVTAERKPE